jgi:hypothetical protein
MMPTAVQAGTAVGATTGTTVQDPHGLFWVGGSTDFYTWTENGVNTSNEQYGASAAAVGAGPIAGIWTTSWLGSAYGSPRTPYPGALAVVKPAVANTIQWVESATSAANAALGNLPPAGAGTNTMPVAPGAGLGANYAHATATFDLGPVGGKAGVNILASAPAAGEEAAAKCADPITLPPDTYSYTASINSDTQSPYITSDFLQIQTPGDSAEVVYSADDSSSSVPLWQLIISPTDSSAGLFTSPSGLTASFIYDSSRLTIDDPDPIEDIENEVLDDITVPTPGTAMIAPLELFTGTYTVAESTDYEYDAAGDVETVPEPASLSLLAAASVLGLRRRRQSVR